MGRSFIRIANQTYGLDVSDDYKSRTIDLDAFHAHPAGCSIDQLTDIYEAANWMGDDYTRNAVADQAASVLSSPERRSGAYNRRALWGLLESLLDDFTSDHRVWPFMKLTQDAEFRFEGGMFATWIETTRLRFTQFHSYHCQNDPDGSILETQFSAFGPGSCLFHDNCANNHHWTVPPSMQSVSEDGVLLAQNLGHHSMDESSDAEISDAASPSWFESFGVEGEDESASAGEAEDQHASAWGVCGNGGHDDQIGIDIGGVSLD